MARRRYLSTEISVSKRVNRLAVEAGDFAALLYTWMIPHAEDDCRITGDPEELLFKVVPGRRDKTIEDVRKALEVMASKEFELIHWPVVENGTIYAEINPETFYEYQTYIPVSKRRPPWNTSAQNAEDQLTTPKNAEDQRSIAQSAEEARGVAQNTASPSPSPSPSPSLSLKEYSPPTLDGEVDKSHTDPALGLSPDRITELWNEVCGDVLPKARGLPPKRRQHIQMRSRVKGRDEAWWQTYFSRIRASPFLCGDNDRGWKASIDFAIRSEDMVAKILEGQYSRSGGRAAPGSRDDKYAGVYRS